MAGPGTRVHTPLCGAHSLDGTDRGGIAVSIIDRLGIPVKLVGIGEKPDDLRDFDPRSYAEALFARKPGGSSPHPS